MHGGDIAEGDFQRAAARGPRRLGDLRAQGFFVPLCGEGLRWYTMPLPRMYPAIASSSHQGETETLRRFGSRERLRSHSGSTGSQQPKANRPKRAA